MNEPITASVAMDTETGKDVDPTLAIQADGTETENPQRKCCGCFHGHQSVIGYNILGLGRGGVVMSNIYLATSLIYLACKEAGGVDPVTDECVNSDLTVYGMKPSALISNIAIVSGLLSAFLMPVFGAIVDYTDHRKMMGVLSAALLTVIEAIKIGTVESTWFAIAILQAFAGFLYQIQVVSVYAYLPEMAREVGQNRMNNYTSIFQQSQFSSQAIYTIVVVGISFGLSLGTVQTAMVGQGTVVIWCVILFSWGWKYLPARRARHTLNDGQWLLLAGFAQNWKTAKAIWTQYRKGVKWYLLATIFAEASTAAITSISVIYLTDVVGLSVAQIGIFFLITLVSTIPGAKLGSIITHHTNPNTSWKLSQVAVLICMLIGALTLDNLKGPKELCYIWGVSVGVLLGWYYPAMNLFFSMCLPQGQEAELAGFWVYCTQILAWLPPLVFTVLVQNDVDQKYGVISISFGYVVSVLLLSCTSPWDEILEEADHNKNLCLLDDDVC